MTTLTHDAGSRSVSAALPGIGYALVSALAFGMAGSLAKGLVEAGWSTGAVAVVRILGGFAVLAIPAAMAMRGRWSLLGDNTRFIALYGVTAVAVAQFCFFSAVVHLQVGVALLIEYTAPVLVVAWFWFRHGAVPTRTTVIGMVLAGLGLVLLLDLAGAGVNLVGVLWGLGAMAGLAMYFVLSAQERAGLPPLVLAAGGLLVGGLALLAAGALGLIPLAAAFVEVPLAGASVAWWVPMAALVVLASALAYVTGIEATRRLGARFASFVGLAEVVAALLFAWLLLSELPGLVQLLGGVLVLAGVVAVKAGERPLVAA
ncbi:EamA family transporter [Nocardioides limicola]|uniref:EamA family transporter n=1 Tax=Nocardioides limicola TaxID=2803368 RepID=UPI00193BA9E0|nr:DMT family transporter [Nocardioides sp. DJM-14]